MTMPRIRSLLELRLSTWASARNPTLPIAWEGVPFEPPAGMYLRAFIMPAPTDSGDLASAHREYRGVFQVSIAAPNDAGPGAGEAIAEEIAALFPAALRLTIASPAFELLMLTPMSIAQAIPEPDRRVVPVFAQYRADTI